MSPTKSAAGQRIDIQQLKLMFPLTGVVEKLTGQQLVKNKIHCPLGDDRNPSFHIYEDGRWYCFHCGRHGDVIDLVGLLLHGAAYSPHIHLKEAIDYLGSVQIQPLPRVEPPASPRAPAAETTLPRAMAEDYHFGMGPQERAWWRGRGLTDETINWFMLGYDGRRYTIPNFYRGVLVGIKKRRDDWAEPTAEKYISEKGSRVMLFNADALNLTTDTVIITEGEIDCMLLAQLGYDAVSSTGGAGTFRPEWATHFWHARQVVILMDNDGPGREGASRIGQLIRRARVTHLPAGYKDVGSVFEKQPTAAPDIIGDAIARVTEGEYGV